MTLDQAELLQEARSSINAARLLLESGYPGYASSRAYYGMFYIAQSFLEGEGLAFSKHSAVIAAFGREFARTGRVPVEFHQFLIQAQETRLDADYGGPRVDTEQAREQIDQARAIPCCCRGVDRAASGGGRLGGFVSGTSSRNDDHRKHR